MKRIFYFLLITVLVTSCTTENDSNLNLEDAQPIALRAGLEKRVAQDNAFAFDLLNNTIKFSDETNVFVSPLSVSIALGMAWNGAAGETKTQIETALKMSGLSAVDINEYYRVMQTSLPKIDPSTKLSIANALWYRTGFEIKPAFLKANTDNFNTYVKEIDFSQAWALDTINNWCSKSTKGLIPTILEQIPQSAVMYLMNAVYFKGIWKYQFDKKETYERDFTNEAGYKQKVNMMCQKDTFAYMADDLAQYIDLPYGNKAFSMTVILPNEGISNQDVLDQLTVENWNLTLDEMVEREVLVYLPRFKLENKFTLNEVLETMGMPVAFTGFADFSGISNEQLVISEVLHKTYITVDEEGTEAAAVTSIGFVTTSVPNYPVFNVNKPFIFVIREKSTGVILFIGKIGKVDKY